MKEKNKKEETSTERETEQTSETNVENELPAEEKTEANDWESKYTEVNDKYLRLYSEFDNYRKRTGKEKTDLIRFGGEDIIKAMLSIVDDFERALEAMQNHDEVHKEGIQLIYNKLVSTLQQKGVKTISAKGEKFNEEFHEAVGQMAAPSETEKGTVFAEVEKGYLLHDKVIRYSKVIVAI